MVDEMSNPKPKYCDHCEKELGNSYHTSPKLINGKFCSWDCLDLEKSDLDLKTPTREGEKNNAR